MVRLLVWQKFCSSLSCWRNKILRAADHCPNDTKPFKVLLYVFFITFACCSAVRSRNNMRTLKRRPASCCYLHCTSSCSFCNHVNSIERLTIGSNTGSLLLRIWMLAVWCISTKILCSLLVMMLLYDLGTAAQGSSSWHCLVTSVRSQPLCSMKIQTNCWGKAWIVKTHYIFAAAFSKYCWSQPVNFIMKGFVFWDIILHTLLKRKLVTCFTLFALFASSNQNMEVTWSYEVSVDFLHSTQCIFQKIELFITLSENL